MYVSGIKYPQEIMEIIWVRNTNISQQKMNTIFQQWDINPICYVCMSLTSGNKCNNALEWIFLGDLCQCQRWIFFNMDVYQNNWCESVMLGAWATFTTPHWGRVTHICVGKLTVIDSDNGLSPGRRQAIIWTNAVILLNNLQANVSATVHLFGGDSSHTPFFDWQSFQGYTLIPKQSYIWNT